jgi:hypothetical protein
MRLSFGRWHPPLTSVCVYVCMYVRTYVCIHECMICMYVCMYVCKHVPTISWRFGCRYRHSYFHVKGSDADTDIHTFMCKVRMQIQTFILSCERFGCRYRHWYSHVSSAEAWDIHLYIYIHTYIHLNTYMDWNFHASSTEKEARDKTFTKESISQISLSST